MFLQRLKEDEVWTAENRSLEEARASIDRRPKTAITLGLVVESEITRSTRPSWLSQVY
jgi:hypothetical protein